MTAPVSEGDVVLDKYRVERVLGQGGMGVVVAATHVDLDQKVALKFLLPEALAHPELVERFAREAKAAARIQSQHVVRVIDTGRMPSGAPFMVMEYLEGQDLGELLDREARLPRALAVDYVLQALEAIGEAHAAGIVHRDLKPSNLFLAKQRDRRQIVKVLDFGISKLEDRSAAPITRTATMMGSPHYMSPEQLVSSRDVDPRSDIWSLGVILYELVAGRRPFSGESMPEVVGQILRNAPERLGALVPDVGLDFELVVARCLASEPENRFASVAQLAEALRGFASDSAVASLSAERTARVLGAASVPPASAVTAPESAPIVVVPSTRRGDDELGATVRPAVKAEAVTLPESVEASSTPKLTETATPVSSPLGRAVSAATPAEGPSGRSRLVVGSVVAVACLALVAVFRDRGAPPSAKASGASSVAPVVPSASAAVDVRPTPPPEAPAASALVPSASAASSVVVAAPGVSARPTATRSASPTRSAAPVVAGPSSTPTTSSTGKSPLQMGIK